MSERETMLKAAIAACFKERKGVNVKNVKAKLPADFFVDFDSGKPLADADVFAEIQATFKTVPKPRQLIDTNPEGHKIEPMVEPVEPVEDFSGDDDGESLRHEWAPETVSMPVVEAKPAEQVRPVCHETAGHELNPQARLDAARKREQVLLGERPILQAAQRNAREALAKAVRAYQEGGPRQDHESLARDFIKASNAERAAKARGELWATKPERRTRNGAAHVDVARQYSQGGDANDFARQMNPPPGGFKGNRRGAYSKAALGQTNRDPSRGPIPAPVVEKPTIPALGK